jgi:hypothetical protein
MDANDGVRNLWLVDTYENLPDFDGLNFIDGTMPTVDASWQSPFATQSLSEIATWVRGVPKPPKAISKQYFAVVKKRAYEENGKVLVCKIVKRQAEPQTIPIDVTDLGVWVRDYKRHGWRDNWKAQRF